MTRMSEKPQENSRKRQRTKIEKTALMKAVDLLARAEHSTAHLARKLAQRGYEEEEIKAALAALTERGYLDDEEACRHQFAFLYEESRQSVRQITAKLMQKGFSAALIAECVPGDTFERERSAAGRCLVLHFKKNADAQKMLQHLYRRGFSTAVCRAAVADFTEEEED